MPIRHSVFDRAAVDDGGMADGHFVGDLRRVGIPHHVDNGAILDVGRAADPKRCTSPRMTTHIHTLLSSPIATSPMT